MDRFLRFAAGVAIAVVYGVLALALATSVLSVTPDLWALCLAVVALGWVAIAAVAFRREQPWIGYGVLAAPFVTLLLITVSCFVAFNASSTA